MVYICKGMFLAGDTSKPTELTALQMGNIQVWNKDLKDDVVQPTPGGALMGNSDWINLLQDRIWTNAT